MKIALSVLTALYAALSMLAAAVQWKTAQGKGAPAAMTAGGLLLLGAAGLYLAGLGFAWLALAVGGCLIGAAAFYNGKHSGAFHPAHHLVRLGFTALLLAGYLLVK